MTEQPHNTAKDVTFTTIEMELMFKSNQEAYQDFKRLWDSSNVVQRNQIIVVEEFKSLKEYTHRALKSFATNSMGDVVLTEGGKEIKRVKSNYKTNE